MKVIIIYLVVFWANGKVVPTGNTFQDKEVCEAYVNYRNVADRKNTSNPDYRHDFMCAEIDISKLPTPPEKK